MKYYVKYHNKFYDTRFNSNEHKLIHAVDDSITCSTKEQCIEIVKEFLDAPDVLLTFENIKNDFGAFDKNTDDIVIEKFLKYYNGRYSIFQAFLKDIDINGVLTDDVVLQYNIPEECNLFSIDSKNTQIESNIFIKIIP